MKIKLTSIACTVAIAFSALSIAAHAQTATPFQGASDTTTAPPATASAVGQVICSGGTITLKGPADNTGTINYQWYKVDMTGTKKLVKNGVNNDNLYTEASTTAGYYTYQLIESNGNNCTSQPSDPFSIYVLPALNPTISGNASLCASSTSTTVLKVAGLVNPQKYSYTYQWARNGQNIVAPAGTADSYTVSETTNGSYTYTVKVAYALNAACTQTASQVITVAPVPTKPTILFGN